ncbi:alpha-amylase family glycosyl hydrolase [Portibacter lacus]|nr:alpha-amylase family glycosyl hydrolase [Portibacter lacus]
MKLNLFFTTLLTLIFFNLIQAQPTIDGTFDGEPTWGSPVAIADGANGWDIANINSLYVTTDATYVYVGFSINSAADWHSFGITINTIDGAGGDSDVWGYPIIYGHSELPDFVVKGHFGNGGTPYAEVRKWENGSWGRVDNSGADNGLSTSDFVAEESGFVEVRLAKSVLGQPSVGDFQVYISGNVSSDHATFDACPDDEVAELWQTSTTLGNYVNDISLGGTSIVTVSPTLPSDNEPVTITFDASSTALAGQSKVYLHVGVATSASDPNAFNNVVGNWGQDDGIGEMTNTGSDMWEINLATLRTYFNVDITDDVFGLNFLFRSADGSLKEDNVGSNYHNDVDPGDHFTITTPDDLPYFALTNTNIPLQFEANAAPNSWVLDEIDAMGMTLSNIDNGGNIATFNTQDINSTPGIKHYKITANFGSGTKYKTFQLQYYDPVVEASRPSGANIGINYNENDPTKAILVLHAPTFTRYYKHPSGVATQKGQYGSTEKKVVHVIGDFNNWTADESSKMFRDRDGWDSVNEIDQDADGDRGDYWWIELENLVPGQAYVFQYLIDGTLQVADPYTLQVSDFDDVYISSERNDEIVPYPSQADGRASILQTDQDEYAFEASVFSKPSINNLNIYELHFRDFTEEGTYAAAIERLDYLEAMGINAIHVMPVSEFEGNSSWGYNPNFYFASDKYYGPPQDLKQFIDECHKREIQVFNDIVLNHAFYSNVMARMYWNEDENKPANDNPWFNPDHKMIAEPAGWWGVDWNHESEHTQKMVDSILDFWIQEFQFDGFRFDFTKGFGQTAQDGGDPWASSYDQDRIDLLLRMVNEMQTRNPGSVAIFEHLANASEDAVLADAGILMWSGAGHHSDMKEFMLGYNGQNIYDSGIFNAKGFTYANLMSYMESHDEERQAYEVKTYGKGNENYTTGDVIDRLKIGAVFNLLFPGPRMLWQFEELGYDISIDFNGRTGEKPVHWEYFYDQDRQELWRLMAMIFHLRNTYPLYTMAPDYGNIGSSDGVNVGRRMELNDGSGHYVISIANLDPENSTTLSPGYDVTGTWYKYNGDQNVDGTSYTVNSTADTYTLAPSESLILTNFDIAWTDDCSGPNACCVRTVYTWNGGVGNWGDSEMWDLNSIPKQCDMVIIPAGSTVTIPEGTTAHARYVWAQDGSSLEVIGELLLYDEKTLRFSE